MQFELPFIEPMECKAVKDLAQLNRGQDWQYEIKFDGYRCVAIKYGRQVKLFSRNGRPFTQFPNLIHAVGDLKQRWVVLDGEIVALDAQGRTDFNALQNFGRGIKAHFFVFDLLQLNEKNLQLRPLFERQQLLAEKIAASEYLHLAGPLGADLDTVAEKVVEFGFEGVIAKKRDSIYTPGKAPGTWLKKKIKETDEFIIGGFIPSGRAVDAIVVGRYAGKHLKFVASVDDGFVPAMRRKVFEALETVPRLSKCPFENLPERTGGHKFDAEKMARSIWVKPKLVVEIAMNEWTRDNHLRHSEFLRLHPDLKISDVASYP
jgi:bifunctional non-homologous end joining protein LigD